MKLSGPAIPQPLPYTPCPFPGELLSSWLARIAAEFGVTLAHLADHLGISASTKQRIDTALMEADLRKVAAATRSSTGEVRKMVHRPLEDSVRSLVASQRPIQFCARCRARHGSLAAGPVAIRAWFEYWHVECAQCQVPFESAVRPDLRRYNPAREDPQWFDRLLPAAKAGGARLADFAERPHDVALTPSAVLNLMSMRLELAAGTRHFAGCGPHLGWDVVHYVAELFVPGLRERTSPQLIPQTWTANAPVRLVAARAILLAAMEAFLQDASQAFARVAEAANGTTAVSVNRWFVRLPPASREMLVGGWQPAVPFVSHLQQL